MATKPSDKKAADTATTVNAIKLLTDDHKEVHALFLKYKKLLNSGGAAADRQPLAEQICLLLTVHATIEEEIFYPAARAADVESDLLDEAEVEHASVKDLIAQIRDMGQADDLYDAKVTVLGEYVDHHVKEEQDEIFPKCANTEMDLKAIGAELAARKAELTAEMTEGMKATQ